MPKSFLHKLSVIRRISFPFNSKPPVYFVIMYLQLLEVFFQKSVIFFINKSNIPFLFLSFVFGICLVFCFFYAVMYLLLHLYFISLSFNEICLYMNIQSFFFFRVQYMLCLLQCIFSDIQYLLLLSVILQHIVHSAV